LSFDFVDELGDASRGSIRFRMLDSDKRGLILLIGEIALEQPVCGERAADENDQDGQILSKQATPMRTTIGGVHRRTSVT